MSERTPEDLLREEYFDILPDVRRVLDELEAKVRYCLLPVSNKLKKYERLVVTSRIKDCESALGALRRRIEGATFDPACLYTLTKLKDLAGVRVLAFPQSRRNEANSALRLHFQSWTADPVRAENGDLLAFKYHGFCDASSNVQGELQVAPLLTGLFWQVEHSTIYKPSPALKGVGKSPEMKARKDIVMQALAAFEDEFERLVRSDPIG